ncbi:unnamed protein product, partial [Mycena citricolor]
LWMANIGSAFLGDATVRRRVLSSTASNSTGTPPSSPPPTSMSAVFSSIPSSSSASPNTKSPAVIEPALSLELRLRWLEAILLGVKQLDTSKALDTLPRGETLVRAADDIQKRLNAIVSSNDGLKRFIDRYDQHEALLASSSAPSEGPTYQNISASELEVLLVEMEPDIRAAERDMQEIELLEEKGITGAGKLADHESLQPRLDALIQLQQEDLALAASLEKRLERLMQTHATQVDALSELFVAWDDAVLDTELRVHQLEKYKQERQRLGLE